jgi:hypothetical protein
VAGSTIPRPFFRRFLAAGRHDRYDVTTFRRLPDSPRFTSGPGKPQAASRLWTNSLRHVMDDVPDAPRP